MKISEVIRNYRKKENLTQEQVANYLNISAPAVNKWKNVISYPDITLLVPFVRRELWLYAWCYSKEYSI